MARPTLRTIAAMTGFSVTTVSRALKDGPELSLETRARIKALAQEIGYMPNRAGVRLRTGRTYVVAMVLNQADEIDQFTRNMLLGMSSALKGSGYHLVVLPQTLDEDPMDPVRYVVENGAADGLILTHTEPNDPRVRLLNERDFPFATHGRTELGTQHPWCDFDNFEFTLRATRYLIGRGRSRIALVRPPARYTYAAHQVGGYMRAIYEAGLKPSIPDAISLDSDPEELRRFAMSSTGSAAAPDGWICGSENRCLGLIAGTEEAGLKVGKDVDIVAKETTRMLDFLKPRLTSFAEDLTLAGRELAGLVLRRIAGEPPATLQILHEPVMHDRAPSLANGSTQGQSSYI